jgi:hypothetical protein
VNSKVISILSILLAVGPSPGIAQQKALKIVVLEGDGAFNDIKRKLARNIIVEVHDEGGRLVQGAQVVFTLPEVGPSGSFAGGVKKFTATTDGQGRASTNSLKPNTSEGRFNIKVAATAPDASGSIVISQSNTLAGGVMGADTGGGSSTKKLLLLLAISGGAAGGIYAGTHRGGSSSAAAPPTPTTLTVGSVTVGGLR